MPDLGTKPQGLPPGGSYCRHQLETPNSFLLCQTMNHVSPFPTSLSPTAFRFLCPLFLLSSSIFSLAAYGASLPTAKPISAILKNISTDLSPSLSCHICWLCGPHTHAFISHFLCVPVAWYFHHSPFDCLFLALILLKCSLQASAVEQYSLFIILPQYPSSPPTSLIVPFLF